MGDCQEIVFLECEILKRPIAPVATIATLPTPALFITYNNSEPIRNIFRPWKKTNHCWLCLFFVTLIFSHLRKGIMQTVQTIFTCIYFIDLKTSNQM